MPGGQFLAGAGFAGDQYGEVDRGEFADGAARDLQHGAVADQLLRSVRGRLLGVAGQLLEALDDAGQVQGRGKGFHADGQQCLQGGRGRRCAGGQDGQQGHVPVFVEQGL